ncbi:MAG: TraB/GumN family protein [Pseudomonadota bacterium]
MDVARQILTVLMALGLLTACGGEAADSTNAPPVADEVADGAVGPALWTVSDEDTTLYLLGTVHVLRPEIDWLTPQIREALEASDTVYFEADVDSPAAQEALTRAVTELGLYTDGSTLRDLLADPDEQEVAETAELLGLPFAGINNFRPWFAAIALSDVHLNRLGFSRDEGVEQVLGAEVERLGQDVRYFETGAEQISLLSSISEAAQIDMLVFTAEQIEDDPNFLDRMVAEWVEGDVETLGALIATDQAFGAGEAYDIMLAGRNARWADTLTTLMDEEAGTFFIAVGAAHLVGEDSVQVLLEGRGLTVDRQ